MKEGRLCMGSPFRQSIIYFKKYDENEDDLRGLSEPIFITGDEEEMNEKEYIDDGLRNIGRMAASEAAMAMVNKRETVKMRLEYQKLHTEARLKNIEHLLELIEKNPDFETLLDLSRELL